GNGTPLIPDFLNPDGSRPPDLPPPVDGTPPAQDPGSRPTDPRTEPAAPPAAPPDRAPPLTPPEPDRYTVARANFSRFARTGGDDRRWLGRALSGYVSKSAGGARQAAQRMGSARGAGARLAGFLNDVRDRGAAEALRALNLEALVGRPIEEIFLGLADYICPDGGTVDEGIAREAFIEAVAELAEKGITDLDGLNADQMQTVFEMYAAHAIEARICNEIGTKSVALPSDPRAVQRVQDQLRDFVRRSVSDALTSASPLAGGLTQQRVLDLVDQV